MRKKWNPIINYHIKYDRIITYTNHINISKSSYLASIFVPFLVFYYTKPSQVQLVLFFCKLYSLYKSCLPAMSWSIFVI